MRCYECSKAGRNQEAIGLGHYCSAGLCADHAFVTAEPVRTTYALCRTVVLPQKAPQLLCGICLRALQQVGAREMAETSQECLAPSTAE